MRNLLSMITLHDICTKAVKCLLCFVDHTLAEMKAQVKTHTDETCVKASPTVFCKALL